MRALDAASQDGGLDAGSLDAGPDADANGNVDADARDASPIDAGIADVGAADVGTADAGSADTGAADAGVDAGGAASACDDLLSGALFCDGFERTDLFPWGVDNMTGSLVAQTTAMPYRGAGSLRTDIFTGGSNSDVFTTTVGGVSSGNLYARGYFYVPSGSSFDYLVFLSFSEDVPPYGSLNVVFVDGPRLALQAVPTPTDNEFEMGAPFVPVDRWFCVQLSVVVSDISGSVAVSIDGVTIATLPDVRTAPAAGFQGFSSGAAFTDPTQPAVHYFADEIAYGRNPLPCDP